MNGLALDADPRADISFTESPAKLATPGSDRVLSGVSIRKAPLKATLDAAMADVESSIQISVVNAERRVASKRSTTTLAGLASAYEIAGASGEAASVARDALNMARVTDESLDDPVSIRLAIEVLVRNGTLDEALSAIQFFPLTRHVRLMLAATLASVSRFAEASDLLAPMSLQDAAAVRGFVFALEGRNSEAIPLLRRALRDTPDDVDSAMNLSIVLWRLGSTSKALALALRAYRTAPSREDIGTYYMELLATLSRHRDLEHELDQLLERGVKMTARLLTFRARSRLGLGRVDEALKILERAESEAIAENDLSLFSEVKSNRIKIRGALGKIGAEDGLEQLAQLRADFPQSEVVAVSIAQMSSRAHQAALLSEALEDVRSTASPSRRAFMEYRLATLKGDNKSAAFWAEKWYGCEPKDPQAVSAAVVALGIGQERWSEAAAIARQALELFPGDRVQINNAAYVFALNGDSERALSVLRSIPVDDYVLEATLGLAMLSGGQLEAGLRCYRRAADEAERYGSRSLLTTYQQLIIRQLKLIDVSTAQMVIASSLPSVDLPDDWADDPEFLRLYGVAKERGFSWPLSTDL